MEERKFKTSAKCAGCVAAIAKKTRYSTDPRPMVDRPYKPQPYADSLLRHR